MLSREDLIAMKPLSSDSHTTEPPDTYTQRLDKKYRDRAPYLIDDPVKGAVFMVDGVAPINIGGASGAGLPTEQIALGGRTFDKLHKGGWDALERVADMDRDGVYGEVLFPSTGMSLYATPDIEYGSACMKAYNRWLAEDYVAALPKRLWGVGQTNAVSPAELVKDLHAIRNAGFVGAMMPMVSHLAEDFDNPIWDPAWEAAVELQLPLCFHVLPRDAKGSTIYRDGVRGTKLNNIMNVIRANQDLLGVFIFGGVFERHPDLKIVCVEADAGWVPHHAFRMDHAYERFHHAMSTPKLSRKPSEYVADNISFTFQDDLTAFRLGDLLSPKNMLWASDYPHSDATWPHSMSVLSEQTQGLDRAVVKQIIHDNTKRVFNLPVD